MFAKQKVIRSVFGMVAACLTLTAVGCGGGGDGPKLYSVSGDVTFNGEPVKEGRITFKMEEPGGRSYSAPIADGEYKVEAEAGPAIVEITSSRLIPGKFDNSNGTPEPVGEMYVPKKYNSASTLKVEIASGKTTFPFELMAK